MIEQIVVRAANEVDYDTIGVERCRLERAAELADTVVWDLSTTQFFSSAGMAALLEAQRRLAERSKQLVVVAPTRTAVRRLLELASLPRLVRIVERVPLKEATR